MTLDEVRLHYQWISYYRETVRLSDEIIRIRKSEASLSEKHQAIRGIRKETRPEAGGDTHA